MQVYNFVQEEKIPSKRENAPDENIKKTLSKETKYDHIQNDPSYLGLLTHSFTAPAAKTESVTVPYFAGDKRKFEH